MIEIITKASLPAKLIVLSSDHDSRLIRLLLLTVCKYSSKLLVIIKSCKIVILGLKSLYAYEVAIFPRVIPTYYLLLRLNDIYVAGKQL